LSWLLIICGCGPASVVLALVATTTACSLGRIWFGWRQLDMRPADWVKEVLRPLAAVAICAFVAGSAARFTMEASFTRICATSLLSFGAMMVSGWFVVLGRDERKQILERVTR